jgi:hypothetical protein
LELIGYDQHHRCNHREHAGSGRAAERVAPEPTRTVQRATEGGNATVSGRFDFHVSALFVAAIGCPWPLSSPDRGPKADLS